MVEKTPKFWEDVFKKIKKAKVFENSPPADIKDCKDENLQYLMYLLALVEDKDDECLQSIDKRMKTAKLIGDFIKFRKLREFKELNFYDQDGDIWYIIEQLELKVGEMYHNTMSLNVDFSTVCKTVAGVKGLAPDGLPQSDTNKDTLREIDKFLEKSNTYHEMESEVKRWLANFEEISKTPLEEFC